MSNSGAGQNPLKAKNASNNSSNKSDKPLTPEQLDKLRECKKNVWKEIMDDCASKGANCHIVKTCSENGFKLPGTNEPLIGSKHWPLSEPREKLHEKEQEINKLFGDKKMFRKAMKCVGKRVNEEYGSRYTPCYEGLPVNQKPRTNANANKGAASDKPGAPNAKPSSPNANKGAPNAKPSSPNANKGAPNANKGAPNANKGALNAKPSSPNANKGALNAKPSSPNANKGAANAKPNSNAKNADKKTK